MQLTKGCCFFQWQQSIDRIRMELETVQDKYRREVATRRKLHEKCMELEGNIRVFCRSRPVLPVDGHEAESNKVVVACLPVSVEREAASKFLAKGGIPSNNPNGDESKNVFLKFTEIGAAHYGRPGETYLFDTFCVFFMY